MPLGLDALVRSPIWGVVVLAWIVVLMHHFIDRAVILAVDGLPQWVIDAAHFLEWFGLGTVPIAGGLLWAGATAVVALSFAPGASRRIIWALSQSGLLVAVTSIWAGLIVILLKRLAGRPRPWAWLNNGDYDWVILGFRRIHVSIPSGHTATAFAFAAALSMLFPRAKWWFIGAATLIGLSRVVSMQHWPSDVLVGAAVGWLAAQIAGRLFVGSEGLLQQTQTGQLKAQFPWASPKR